MTISPELAAELVAILSHAKDTLPIRTDAEMRWIDRTQRALDGLQEVAPPVPHLSLFPGNATKAGLESWRQSENWPDGKPPFKL